MPRPEYQASSDVFYNEADAHEYTTSFLQSRISERALELLALPKDGVPKLLLDIASASVILCGMWSLWRSQNDLKHGKKAIPMKKAIDWAMDSVTNLLTGSTRTKKQSIRNNIRCSPPPPGVMKINVDAAFSANTGKGSIGAVVRDEEGRFHAAGAWFLESVASSRKLRLVEEGYSWPKTWV